MLWMQENDRGGAKARFFSVFGIIVSTKEISNKKSLRLCASAVIFSA